MNKMKFEFHFTYFMGDSEGEENAENAKYKIEINDVKLLNHEIDDLLLYVNNNLRKEIGHCIINNRYINDQYVMNIQTDQIECEKIMPLLEKLHSQFKVLFKDSTVEDIVQSGHNDLAYNTNKPKL